MAAVIYALISIGTRDPYTSAWSNIGYYSCAQAQREHQFQDVFRRVVAQALKIYEVN